MFSWLLLGTFLFLVVKFYDINTTNNYNLLYLTSHSSLYYMYVMNPLLFMHLFELKNCTKICCQESTSFQTSNCKSIEIWFKYFAPSANSFVTTTIILLTWLLIPIWILNFVFVDILEYIIDGSGVIYVLQSHPKTICCWQYPQLCEKKQWSEAMIYSEEPCFLSLTCTFAPSKKITKFFNRINLRV